MSDPEPRNGFEGLEASLLITIEQAARLLCLGRTRTYELVLAGRIQSVKVGRRRLVVRRALDTFVDQLLAEQTG